MTRIASRLAALEELAGGKGEPLIIAFMLAAAADEEVTEIHTGSQTLQRLPGDRLVEMVDRAKATQPRRGIYVLQFDYSPETYSRLGGETLPDTWPEPTVRRLPAEVQS
jgi:hypothetical protein